MHRSNTHAGWLIMPGGLREDHSAGGVARSRGGAQACRVADPGRRLHRPRDVLVLRDPGASQGLPGHRLPASPQVTGAATIVDIVLPRLVDELDDLGDVTLVLDHRLADGATRESLTWFVDHLPRTFQLVLSTRMEPDLPLAALVTWAPSWRMADARPSSADLRYEVVSGLLRLPCLSPSRRIPCTNSCTNLVRDDLGADPD
jgi:hypothetical protein